MTTFTNQKAMLKTRGAAILTGGVLAATALFHPAPAQAQEKKDKLYKGGAAVLGALGAYYIFKGKTVPGAIAGAGAYYAYKKGKDAQNDERYNDDRYSDNYYSNDNPSDDYYADDYYADDDYDNGNYSNDNDNSYDGSWSTPAANNNRNRDYNGIAPSKKNSGGTIILK